MSNLFFYEPSYDFEVIFENLINDGAQAPKAPSRQQAKGSVNGAVRAFKPKLDLHENKDTNTVSAFFEFPGILKEDIHIEVHNGKLTVSAETRQSSDLDERGYAVRERQFGRYSRTLQLPQGVKVEDIKASMENGVLTVTFPRTMPELGRRQISIA